MDVVRAFNNELSSLYEVKPPISKAKMTQITKSAIKGLKFYKHIVQSVEKFIQKCRPEYKVPGLYVVDSIVRQSRHQFGSEKDVFAPRFTKNIGSTFQNLFKCSEDDRPKIVRVLNLWQKNNVFPSDIIQPLLDMAHPNPIEDSVPPPVEDVPHSKHKSAELSAWKGWPQVADEPSSESHGFTEMSTKNLEKFTKSNPIPESVLTSQKNQHKTSDVKPVVDDNTVKFNKKLLEFDYGEEEDEMEDSKPDDNQLSNAPNPLALSMAQNLLSNPELLRQLQQMQQTIQQNEALQSELRMQSEPDIPKENKEPFSPPVVTESAPVSIPFQVHNTQPCFIYPQMPPVHYAEPPPSQLNIIPFPPPTYENALPFPMQPPPMSVMEPSMPMEMPYQHPHQLPALPQEPMAMAGHVDEDDRVLPTNYSMPGEPPLPPQDLDERALLSDDLEGKRSRSRSGSRSRGRTGRHRSRSRSPRRKKSRSRSRSRSRRNRSRSRERERERQKEREREREKERERERERRKKGIPPVKKNFLTVCSTTLWMGHVPKTCAEEDITSTFEDYGTVLSINMIPPRGCAYVVMDRRQDAYKALTKLKNVKMQGSTIKIAWAPGKGVKGKDFKEYWDSETGVSYIPLEKIFHTAESLDLLEEGGSIDEESMPQELQDIRMNAPPRELKQPLNDIMNSLPLSAVPMPPMRDSIVPQTLPPPTMPPALLPPTSMGMPMVLPPHMMQPQFSLPMPGMLPHQPMVVPVGVPPPPNPMMMVPPGAQSLLGGTPLPVGSVPQMPHLPPSHAPTAVAIAQSIISTADVGKQMPTVTTSVSSLTAGDATPTDEDGTRVSSPATVSQTGSTTVTCASISQPLVAPQGMPHFNQAMTVPRPLLPSMPPVSSAGAPIPFPPPQVGFAFPPPPPVRPTHPQGLLPLPNSHFSWPHKTNAAFHGFPDQEVRFSSAISATGNMGQLFPIPIGVSAHSGTAGNNASNQISTGTGVDKASPVKDSSEGLSNADSRGSNRSYQRSGSPRSFDNIKDANSDAPDDQRGMMLHGPFDDFPRDIPMPLLQGMPEFRPGMRPPWIRGPPGARFPHGMRPGMPFPPRGGLRGMHPQMEMEFFHQQQMQGPRMHMGGPRGIHPRRGAGNFQPRDRFGNQREENNFGEDFDRRFGPKEEFGQPRDEKSGDNHSWNEAEDKFSKPTDHDMKQDKESKYERNIGSADKGDSDKKSNLEQARSSNDYEKSKPKSDSIVKSRPPKTKRSEQDLFSDMLRLRGYSQKNKPALPKPKLENKKEEKPSQEVSMPQQNTVVKEDIPKDVPSDKIEQDPVVKPSEEPLTTESTVTVPVVITPAVGSDQDNKSKKDKKRSRWGRTLSEEREFQQQRMNELEFKMQDYVKQHEQSVNSQPVNNGHINGNSSEVLCSSITGDNPPDPVSSDFSSVDTASNVDITTTAIDIITTSSMDITTSMDIITTSSMDIITNTSMDIMTNTGMDITTSSMDIITTSMDTTDTSADITAPSTDIADPPSTDVNMDMFSTDALSVEPISNMSLNPETFSEVPENPVITCVENESLPNSENTFLTNIPGSENELQSTEASTEVVATES